MNLGELTQYIGDEEKAEEVLLELGVLKRYTVCPICGEKRIGRVRSTKYKCYRCNKEWGVRRGSVLEGLKIPLTKFLMAIKLFEFDTSVRESAKQLGLAYNTVYRLYHILRRAIVISDTNYQSFSGEIEMDESYFGGRRKGNRGRGVAGKVPVFGILERGGKGTVEVVPDVKGDTLLELAIKKVKRGSLIYTDRFRSYNGFVSYGFKTDGSITVNDSLMGKFTSMVSKISGLCQRTIHEISWGESDEIPPLSERITCVIG